MGLYSDSPPPPPKLYFESDRLPAAHSGWQPAYVPVGLSDTAPLRHAPLAASHGRDAMLGGGHLVDDSSSVSAKVLSDFTAAASRRSHRRLAPPSPASAQRGPSEPTHRYFVAPPPPPPSPPPQPASGIEVHRFSQLIRESSLPGSRGPLSWVAAGDPASAAASHAQHSHRYFAAQESLTARHEPTPKKVFQGDDPSPIRHDPSFATTDVAELVPTRHSFHDSSAAFVALSALLRATTPTDPASRVAPLWQPTVADFAAAPVAPAELLFDTRQSVAAVEPVPVASAQTRWSANVLPYLEREEAELRASIADVASSALNVLWDSFHLQTQVMHERAALALPRLSRSIASAIATAELAERHRLNAKRDKALGALCATMLLSIEMPRLADRESEQRLLIVDTALSCLELLLRCAKHVEEVLDPLPIRAPQRSILKANDEGSTEARSWRLHAEDAADDNSPTWEMPRHGQTTQEVRMASPARPAAQMFSDDIGKVNAAGSAVGGFSRRVPTAATAGRSEFVGADDADWESMNFAALPRFGRTDELVRASPLVAPTHSVRVVLPSTRRQLPGAEEAFPVADAASAVASSLSATTMRLLSAKTGAAPVVRPPSRVAGSGQEKEMVAALPQTQRFVPNVGAGAHFPSQQNGAPERAAFANGAAGSAAAGAGFENDRGEKAHVVPARGLSASAAIASKPWTTSARSTDGPSHAVAALSANVTEPVGRGLSVARLFVTSITASRQVRDRCRHVRTWLHVLRIPHEEIDVSDNSFLHRRLAALCGGSDLGLPLLLVDDAAVSFGETSSPRFVGGFEAIEDLVENHALRSTLDRLGVPIPSATHSVGGDSESENENEGTTGVFPEPTVAVITSPRAHGDSAEGLEPLGPTATNLHNASPASQLASSLGSIDVGDVEASPQ